MIESCKRHFKKPSPNAINSHFKLSILLFCEISAGIECSSSNSKPVSPYSKSTLIVTLQVPIVFTPTMATFVQKRSARPSVFAKNDALNETANLVDQEWEVIDPTPNVTALFRRFNVRFFENRLECVELEWSTKMYSCAGICYMRRNNLGQSITIRLSEPLLKLRPRKDLVQTLLHEMIHAFAFVKGVREGNGGHGPFFHKKMEEINKVAGTQITVYHTFHDEVNVYKKHVWRCNGICKERNPFFGYVRRVSNRAPGPNDQWWAQHQSSCGGRFEKIAEPEKVKKSRSSSSQRKTSKSVSSIDKSQPRIKDVFGGRQVMRPPSSNNTTSSSISSTVKVPTITTKKLPANIKGFADLGGSGGGGKSSDAHKPITKRLDTPSPNMVLYNGVGFPLGSPVATMIDQMKSMQDQVRSIWLKRYGAEPPTTRDCKIPRYQPPVAAYSKESRIHGSNGRTKENNWQVVDDDLAIKTPYVPFVDLVDSDSGGDDSDEGLEAHNRILTEMSQKTVEERKTMLHDELFDSENDDEIVMIDNEFDDTLVGDPFITGQSSQAGGPITSTRQGAIPKTQSAAAPAVKSFSVDDVIECPICENGVFRGYLAQHMEEGCTGILKKIEFVLNKGIKRAVESRDTLTASSRQGTEERGYPCPNCGVRCLESKINEHLDQCLS